MSGRSLFSSKTPAANPGPVDAFISFVEDRARELAQVPTAEAQAAGNDLVASLRTVAAALHRAAAALPVPTSH